MAQYFCTQDKIHDEVTLLTLNKFEIINSVFMYKFTRYRSKYLLEVTREVSPGLSC